MMSTSCKPDYINSPWRENSLSSKLVCPVTLMSIRSFSINIERRFWTTESSGTIKLRSGRSVYWAHSIKADRHVKNVWGSLVESIILITCPKSWKKCSLSSSGMVTFGHRRTSLDIGSAFWVGEFINKLLTCIKILKYFSKVNLPVL